MKNMVKIIALLMAFTLLYGCGKKAKLTESDVAVLSTTAMEVKMGKTDELSVMNYRGEVKWTSSDSKIATVSDSGVIKPVSIGSVAITAELEDGKDMTCVVEILPGESNVEEIKVTSIYSDMSDITVNYEQSQVVHLKADCSPVDQLEPLTWSSSDETKAVVGRDGQVTVYGNGMVEIYATALNGVTGKCLLRIKNVPEGLEAPEHAEANNFAEVPVIGNDGELAELKSAVPVASPMAQSSIIISEKRVYLSVAEGMKITYATHNTKDSAIKWTSTDKAVAIVDDGYIVGIGEGRAIVSAVTSDGAVASCTVAVGKEAINELRKEVTAK